MIFVKEQKAAHTEAIDYRAVGFMCGLEIHQRLSTKEKLFCSCPANYLDTDNMIGSITRYQRAVAGELGSIDRSAEFEELRNRKFVYRVHDLHTCLVELDEEPPHRLNDDALRVALSLASAMDMKIIDELQPMRKEVVDGSDPSAFQRTTLIGIDGVIEAEGYKVAMPSLFLEEESSAILAGNEDEVSYDPDRLGIPLVEIDTDPYIPDPKAAKAIALYIGTMLRVSGAVQRGIGSIRQDVNVSIKGGARVEIKGLQEVDKLDKFVENEVARQLRLLEIRKELLGRKAGVGTPVDLTDMFRGTTVRIIAGQLEKNGVVFGFRLSGFKGMLGKEVNPDRRLGSEISDYAKMARVNGLIHSDENLSVYGFSAKELEGLKKKLGVEENDAFILIAGKKHDAEKATDLAIERAKYALVGVPLETRGAANNELCTTRFLRPLPGGSRMYPETDARPILVTKELLDWARKNAPSIEKEKEWILSKVSNKAVAEQLLTSQKLPLFKSIVKSTKVDPDFLANTLIQKFTELKRGGFGVDGIDEKKLAEVFTLYGSGSITKQAVEELLKELSLEKKGVADVVASKHLERITGKSLERIVEQARKELSDSKDISELRNKIMAKYRLNVDGAELNALLTRR